jgi:IclR family transcriptional regulator, pca regulon regulatory protein
MTKHQDTSFDGADDEAEESTLSSPVKAVQRAMQIIRLFDCAHPEWSTSELVAQSGLRRTTAFRFVKTLEAEGLIVLSEQTKKYSLGPAVFQMAYVWTSQASLARIAQPHVETLTTVTGETANLMVWNVDGPLCIAHSPTSRPFKVLLSVGQMFTDVANADCKILLAFGPESRRARRLARPLEALTPFTITDPQRYADELHRVTEEEVAYDIQGQQVGVCAVSVPVRDFTNEVRASLSLVVSEMRFGPSEAKRYVQALTQVAAALSYDLGYRSPAGGTKAAEH